MDFSGFALSRDLLYLCGVVSGIAVGFLLSLFRKDLGKGSRNRRVTLALVFFSGTVACLAISYIVSMGKIFTIAAVLIMAGIFLIVFALAVRFPRVVAYPLILLGGLALSWLCVFCLRFPAITDAPVLTLSHAESAAADDMYLIQWAPASPGIDPEDDETSIIQIEGRRSRLNFSAAVFTIGQYYPFVGGRKHGLITEINSDIGQEYYDNSLDNPLARIGYASSYSRLPVRALRISAEYISKTLTLDNMLPGNEISVYIDSFDIINQN